MSLNKECLETFHKKYSVGNKGVWTLIYIIIFLIYQLPATTIIIEYNVDLITLYKSLVSFLPQHHCHKVIRINENL